MSDYTPTDLIVRMRYANGRDNPSKEWAAFDRWLAAHDAEVRADEREQAAQRVIPVLLRDDGDIPTNGEIVDAVLGTGDPYCTEVMEMFRLAYEVEVARGEDKDND